MGRAPAVLLPPAMRRRSSGGLSGADAADLAARSEPLVDPGRAGGGVRAWFGRGQLGPAPGIEDCRRTGSRC